MFQWAASINPKPKNKRWSISGFGGGDDTDRAQRLADMKRGIIRVGSM